MEPGWGLGGKRRTSAASATRSAEVSPTERLLLESLIQGRGLALVVTGAGVSLASGIPTFRGTDPGAVWKRDILELATREFFEREPVESWRWYLERFDQVVAARPNPAHQALVELERWCGEHARREFLLITQNTDALHDKAGSRRLIEVHGRSDRVRCSARRCRLGAPRGSLPRPDDALRRFLEAPGVATLPRCPECEAVLRPHVLWFDEFYGDHESYGWERVLEAGERAEVMLFVGTSFSVGVTEMLLRAGAMRRVLVFSIDPSVNAPPYPFIHHIARPAEQCLPRLVGGLPG